MTGIDVRIVAAPEKSGCSAKASGTIMHPITKEEIEKFGLREPDVKSSVGQVHGKNPDRIALNDSYDCGYLYKDFGWKPIQTVLTAKSAEVLEVTSQPTIIAKQSFVNKTKKTCTYNANTAQQVEHTTETNWSKTNTFEFSQSINYSIKFLGSGVEGSTSMSYSHEVGKGGSESKTTTVSATQGVEIPLDPGESATCQLTASRGVMKVRITYTANVIGDVAVDYMKGYKDHHYWCFDIGSLGDQTGKFQPQDMTEDIEIGFFANATVETEQLDDPGKPKKPDETGQDDKTDQGKKKNNDDNNDKDKKNNNKEDKEKAEKKQSKKQESAVKLKCSGKPCEKCKKCYDWQYHGKKETWDWIRNFLSWKDADWDRWRNQAIGKGFVKRDSGACSDAADSGASDGSARYLSYVFLIHICLCDENPGTNRENQDDNEENQEIHQENQGDNEENQDDNEENQETHQENQSDNEENQENSEENQETNQENQGDNEENQENSEENQETSQEKTPENCPIQ